MVSWLQLSHPCYCCCLTFMVPGIGSVRLGHARQMFYHWVIASAPCLFISKLFSEYLSWFPSCSCIISIELLINNVPRKQKANRKSVTYMMSPKMYQELVTPGISAAERGWGRGIRHRSEARLGCRARSCLKINKKKSISPKPRLPEYFWFNRVKIC